MERVNALAGTLCDADTKIADFWETVYLPHLERNAKASTLHGYKKIWESHLSAPFAGINLRDYQTHHATRFLTSLAERDLGARTIAHIRSLASGMFRHALRLNRITVNPWRDAGSLSVIKKPGATYAYTLEDAEAISNALVDDPLAQLVFCLAAFMGLRPGEISALKWQDIEGNDQTQMSWIHIRRSAWRSIVGTTKTDESVASVPLIEPVKSMLDAWKVRSFHGSEWIFPNRSNKPQEMGSFQKRLIIPILEKKGIRWHGLYAGRRSAATLLVQLTGNAVAAQFVLRHKNLTTTTAFYVKPVQTAAVEGMKLVEETLANRKALKAGEGR
jgi:integrase